MNRLTKDLNTPHDDTTYADVVKDAVDRENIVLTRLKHYEDLEEKLGCPIDVLLKALTNGIFYGNELNLVTLDIYMSDNRYILCELYECSFEVDLKDYKKTWWLKDSKEE